MITVTETQYLDGTGDIRKDVEFKYADAYLIHDGSLTVFKKKTNGEEEPTFEVYYPQGSYSKVVKTK